MSSILLAATGMTTPNPVTDGLVFHIDAGNTSSYSGSGNTAYNLVNNSQTMTLYNVTKQPGTGGRFNFNGTNGYMKTTTNGLTSGQDIAHTVEMFVRFDQYQSTRWWLSVVGQFNNGAHHWISHGNGGQSTAFGVWSGNTQLTLNPFFKLAGQWQHLVVTFNGNNVITGYVDGVQTEQKNNCSDFNFINTDWTIGQPSGTETRFDGKITIMRLYNRALTAAEVRRNFNSGRQRHGI